MLAYAFDSLEKWCGNFVFCAKQCYEEMCCIYILNDKDLMKGCMLVMYVKIEWNHTYIDHPKVYFLKIGMDGYETKKLELYENGKICFTYDDIEQGTFLSEKPFEEIDEYNFSDKNESMTAIYISEEEFYYEWNARIK